MKKLLTTIAILLFGVSVFGQGGFFKPVSKNLFEMDRILGRNLEIDYKPSVWMFRPLVTLSAMQFNFTNPVTVNTFSSLGTGVSYAHFTLQNDEPYMNFAANLIVLFTEQMGGVEPAKLSIAGTVSLWQHLNIGAGYSMGNKRFFLLTGLNINFNN